MSSLTAGQPERAIKRLSRTLQRRTALGLTAVAAVALQDVPWDMIHSYATVADPILHWGSLAVGGILVADIALTKVLAKTMPKVARWLDETGIIIVLGTRRDEEKPPGDR